jgi:hypothetical protein
MKKHRFCFRVKGTYYYLLEEAVQNNWIYSGKELHLTNEPDNEFDSRAIQVWLHEPSALIGYIPRKKTYLFHYLQEHHYIYHIKVQSIINRHNTLRLYACLEFHFHWWHWLQYYWYRLNHS